MARDFKGAMSPETERLADEKFKFKNVILEAGDQTAIRLIDNHLLEPLLSKLPEDIQDLVVSGLAEVIKEMPVVEI